MHVFDKTPLTYKPMEQVIVIQHEVVEVLHTLKQAMCLKR